MKRIGWPVLIGILGLVVIGLGLWWAGVSLRQLSDGLFMVGLGLLVIGAGMILEKGHLLTGWHWPRPRGAAPLSGEKVPLHEVGRVKNGSIRITRVAQIVLWWGIICIVGSICLSN